MTAKKRKIRDMILRVGEVVTLSDPESFRGCAVEGYERNGKFRISEIRFYYGKTLIFLAGNVHAYLPKNFR